jgi:hypothetical protein
MKSDRTFSEKAPNFVQISPKNGALLNKNFQPKKLVIKISEFKDKR